MEGLTALVKGTKAEGVVKSIQQWSLRPKDLQVPHKQGVHTLAAG